MSDLVGNPEDRFSHVMALLAPFPMSQHGKSTKGYKLMTINSQFHNIQESV